MSADRSVPRVSRRSLDHVGQLTQIRLEPGGRHGQSTGLRSYLGKCGIAVDMASCTDCPTFTSALSPGMRASI